MKTSSSPPSTIAPPRPQMLVASAIAAITSIAGVRTAKTVASDAGSTR